VVSTKNSDFSFSLLLLLVFVTEEEEEEEEMYTNEWQQIEMYFFFFFPSAPLAQSCVSRKNPVTQEKQLGANLVLDGRTAEIVNALLEDERKEKIVPLKREHLKNSAQELHFTFDQYKKVCVRIRELLYVKLFLSLFYLSFSLYLFFVSYVETKKSSLIFRLNNGRFFNLVKRFEWAKAIAGSCHSQTT
jgi:hypothetical protein